jgi:hypothetical protein
MEVRELLVRKAILRKPNQIGGQRELSIESLIT